MLDDYDDCFDFDGDGELDVCEKAEQDIMLYETLTDKKGCMIFFVFLLGGMIGSMLWIGQRCFVVQIF